MLSIQVKYPTMALSHPGYFGITFVTRAFSQKIFEGEMLNRTQSTILETFCEFMQYSKVFFIKV